jgi:hypothetical protein
MRVSTLIQRCAALRDYNESRTYKENIKPILIDNMISIMENRNIQIHNKAVLYEQLDLRINKYVGLLVNETFILLLYTEFTKIMRSSEIIKNVIRLVDSLNQEDISKSRRHTIYKELEYVKDSYYNKELFKEREVTVIIYSLDILYLILKDLDEQGRTYKNIYRIFKGCTL